MGAIEGQNNELDLVKNKKTKQSDPIGKIKFSDEKLNKLAEDVIKKLKNMKTRILNILYQKETKT